MRRLLVSRRVASRTPAEREKGDPYSDRGRRDGTGDEDPARVPQLAARRIADGSHEVPDRAVARQSRSEAGLEAGARRQGAKRGTDDRRSVNQRRQLWPHGELASGQEAIDGLIEAFGGRAG